MWRLLLLRFSTFLLFPSLGVFRLVASSLVLDGIRYPANAVLRKGMLRGLLEWVVGLRRHRVVVGLGENFKESCCIDLGDLWNPSEPGNLSRFFLVQYVAFFFFLNVEERPKLGSNIIPCGEWGHR